MRREVLFLGALVVLAIALLAVVNDPESAAKVGTSIDLAKKAIGYVAFALGLGTFTMQVLDRGGLTNLRTDEIAGAASLSVIGAILLV